VSFAQNGVTFAQNGTLFPAKGNHLELERPPFCKRMIAILAEGIALAVDGRKFSAENLFLFFSCQTPLANLPARPV
jgi:hypothetical protein